ncbi:MAG TPA: hypothetical protein PLG17_09200 [Thermodesulfobacteriota bacterium]|nr:hypothetical protein [Thermodesulfobacteriota bacterium]
MNWRRVAVPTPQIDGHGAAHISVTTILVVLLLSTPALAWRTKYDLTKDFDESNYAHNFILRKAMEWLNEIGKAPFAMRGKHDENQLLENWRLLEYGSWFADHIAAGPPENENLRVTGINDNLAMSDSFDIAVANGGYDKVRTKWYTGYGDGELGPNTLLVAEYIAESPSGFWEALEAIFTSGITPNAKGYSVDNFYHFALNDGDAASKQVQIDRTHWMADGDTIFEYGAIPASLYGMVLYRIALSFIESNTTFYPDMERDAPYVPRHYSEYGQWSTGRLVMHPLGMDDRIHADAPSMYLGAQPFLCTGSDYNPDPCAEGEPSWPIWVADFESLATSASSQSDVDAFHANLLEKNPSKSWRAGLIYLGWATHMLGDLSQPDHAKDRHGYAHIALEHQIERDILEPGLADHLPTVSSGEAEFYFEGSTKAEICDYYGIPLNTLIPHNDSSGVFQLLVDMRDYSKFFASDIHAGYTPDKDKWAGELSPTAISSALILLNEVIKKTAILLACSSCETVIEDITISGNAPLYSGCRIETSGSVTVQSGADVVMEADERIILRPGFGVQNGATFVARIE